MRHRIAEFAENRLEQAMGRKLDALGGKPSVRIELRLAQKR
jgi:hypothetical protein